MDPMPAKYPPRGFFVEAPRTLKRKKVQDELARIGRQIRDDAGPGHRMKREEFGDRVSVQVLTWTFEARASEARDKTLSKAFSKARTTPQRRF